MRKIPATMVSQHPDHARKPYWHSDAFIRNQEEILEAHSSFFDLGVSEYKWDWEGKFVDEAVVERLLSEYYEDFRKAPLGKEKFLTFRLPNPKVESEFRLGRAFMGILGATGLAEMANMYTPPLFEVILPMCESTQEMAAIQEAFQEISSLKHPLLKIQGASRLQEIEIIPLFEQIEVIVNSPEIVRQYIDYFSVRFGRKPEYLRPYVARSDPALNAGLVPTVLAIKLALSGYKLLAERTGVELYPIIGSACLPFRGGLTPYSVAQFVNEYKGIRTALLQSAFRYDYPLEDVRMAIAQLEKDLPRTEAVSIAEDDAQELQKVMAVFKREYASVIEPVAPIINSVAAVLPKRRERVQHTGLFGYSRGVGSVKLPRAIGFTAALYSVGVPPEIIGTGRGLQKTGAVELVKRHFVSMKAELQRAARYVNMANLESFAKKDPAWAAIREDVTALEKILEIDFAPQTDEENEHLKLTSEIFRELSHHSVSGKTVEEAALLRKSLG
ncbi:MAG: phosphoenolpyruvate carboxylase [Patescibacteria group bacterium]|nr:phosphoenolpyruvate carboxylase [Patescibacteria group bacterium]